MNNITLRVGTLLLAAAVTLAAHPKLAKDLPLKDGAADVDVIIQFNSPATVEHHKKVHKRGGQLKRVFSVVRGGAYRLSARELQSLAEDPEVAYISPDRPVRGTLDFAGPAVGAHLALEYGYDGKGIGVAVIDSGIAPHWDLREGGETGFKVGPSRLVYSERFVPAGGKKPNSTDDEYGHGTHVAGIIAGNGWSSTGNGYFVTIRGMAPKANLVNLRVLDDYGNGFDSYVIAAIERAIELKTKYNIRVMNLSLGRPVYESYTLDPLCQAVEAAWKAGIVVVVAAGNEGRNNTGGRDGYGTISAPGNDPYVITVGAMKTVKTSTRADDGIASYSSKGPTFLDHVVKPDLVAPGNRVASLLMNKDNWITAAFPQNVVPYTYYTKVAGDGSSYTYLWLSGTSMATPMVSGAAALMLQKDPSLTPDQVKARLMKTATKTFPAYSIAADPLTGRTFTSQYDVFTVGAGYLDVWAALNSTDTAGGNAMSPSARFDAASGNVYLIFGNGAVWGTSAVWGAGAVWGSSAVWGAGAVWGTSAVWGASGTSGFSAIWGDSALWGESALWGDRTRVDSVYIAMYGEN